MQSSHIPGWWLLLNRICTPCATGTYSAGGALTACSQCANGGTTGVTYTGAGTNAYECDFTCNAGYYGKAAYSPSLIVSADYDSGTGKVTLYNVTLAQKILLCSAVTGIPFRPLVTSSISTMVYGIRTLSSGLYSMNYTSCALTLYTQTTNERVYGNGMFLYQNETMLIFSDRWSNKIKYINPSQASPAVTVLAGSGTAGSVDGIGTAAQFDYPAGLALNGTTLFIAEPTVTSSVRMRQANLTTWSITTLLTGTYNLLYPISSTCNLGSYVRSVRFSPATNLIWIQNAQGFGKIQLNPSTCSSVGSTGYYSGPFLGMYMETNENWASFS